MAPASSQPPSRGARIVGAQRTELAARVRRRYEAGESIRSLAEDLGRSYGFIQGLLKENDVPLRTRGGATRGSAAEARRAEAAKAIAAVRQADPSA